MSLTVAFTALPAQVTKCGASGFRPAGRLPSTGTSGDTGTETGTVTSAGTVAGTGAARGTKLVVFNQPKVGLTQSFEATYFLVPIFTVKVFSERDNTR